MVRHLPDEPGNYQIITGERRWRAARLAGRRTIAAIVREAQAGEAIELAILENVQRADLNAIEEAAGYRQLIEEHAYTQEALAQRIGKSRPAVAERVAAAHAARRHPSHGPRRQAFRRARADAARRSRLGARCNWPKKRSATD